MQLGTWADWVAAVGTTGAFATGIWLVWRAHNDAQDARAQTDEARKQARRDQASRLFVTVGGGGGSSRDVGGVSAMALDFTARVVNASDFPVTEVVLTLEVDPATAVPSGEDTARVLKTDVVLPGDWTPQASFFLRNEPGMGATAHQVRAALDFTDSAGVRWHRDNRQRLTEVRRAG